MSHLTSTVRRIFHFIKPKQPKFTSVNHLGLTSQLDVFLFQKTFARHFLHNAGTTVVYYLAAFFSAFA